MALVTTVGSPDADSYITVEEAEGLLAQWNHDMTSWVNLPVRSKENCLRLAAAMIDLLPLRGRKANRQTDDQEEQALAFPRDLQFDQTVIPEEVKLAQAEIALLVARAGPLPGDREVDGGTAASAFGEPGRGGVGDVRAQEWFPCVPVGEFGGDGVLAGVAAAPEVAHRV